MINQYHIELKELKRHPGKKKLLHISQLTSESMNRSLADLAQLYSTKKYDYFTTKSLNKLASKYTLDK